MKRYAWLTFFFREKIFLTFVWVTLGYAFFYSLFVRQYTNAFVVFLTIVFTLVPLILKHRYKINLPRGISLFAVFFSYASLFLGEIHHFYERLWWWDTLLHGASALVLGLMGLGIMRMMVSTNVVQATAGVMSVFAFAFALAIGTLWEIVEFSLDGIFHTQMQLNSLADTMSDLIVDALGALLVVGAAYLHWKFHRANMIGRWIDEFMTQRMSQRKHK